VNKPLPADLVGLAQANGLKNAGDRPKIGDYLRQLWLRRDFTVTVALARNSVQYVDSWLGQVWQVLTPLLNFAVYFLIFGLILKTNRGVDNFIAFLMTGVFIFQFTQQAATGGAAAIKKNQDMIRALHFPRAVLPLATTIQLLQQTVVSIAVLMVIIVMTGEPITTSWLLLPFALLLQFMFNVGIAFAFARIGARTKDFSQVLPFVLRTWQYASGVIFSITAFAADLPHWASTLLWLNPAAGFIEIDREILLNSYTTHHNLWPLACFWAVTGLFGGFWFFFRAENTYGR
jgi:teichoic acid transport system permease protein